MRLRTAVLCASIALGAPLVLWMSFRSEDSQCACPTQPGHHVESSGQVASDSAAGTLPGDIPSPAKTAGTATASAPELALDRLVAAARQGLTLEDRLEDLAAVEEEVERSGAKGPLVKRLLAIAVDRTAPLRLRGLCLLSLSGIRTDILPRIYEITEPPEEEWMRLFAAFTLTIRPSSEDYGPGEYGHAERVDFWRGVLRSLAFGDLLAPGFAEKLAKEEKEGTLPDGTNLGGYTFASRYSQTLDDPIVRERAWQTVREGHAEPVRREFLRWMNMKREDGTTLEGLVTDKTQSRVLRCKAIFRLAECPTGSTLATLANILCDPTEEQIVRDNAASTLGTLRNLDRSVLVPMLTSQVEAAVRQGHLEASGLLLQTLVSIEDPEGDRFVTEQLLQSTERDARLRAISALSRKAKLQALESGRVTALGERLLCEKDDGARLALCRSYLAHFESATGGAVSAPPPGVLDTIDAELNRQSHSDNKIAQSLAMSLAQQLSRLRPTPAADSGQVNPR